MRIEVLDDAKDDLIDGFRFYEDQLPGLGAYFLDSIFADIDSLLLYAGAHRIVFGSHRANANRFPFCDLLPCGGWSGSCPSDHRLPPQSHVDSATARKKLKRAGSHPALRSQVEPSL